MNEKEILAQARRDFARSGGNARAQKLSPLEREQIARKGAAVRWKAKHEAEAKALMNSEGEVLLKKEELPDSKEVIHFLRGNMKKGSWKNPIDEV